MTAHKDGDPSYGHCQNKEAEVLHSFTYPKLSVDLKVLVCSVK